MGPAKDTLRLAALSDLHVSRKSRGVLQPIFTEAAASADVLLLCGDLTENGVPAEVALLLKELASVRIPVLAVLGNHDYEAERQDELKDVLLDGGVAVLDGSTVELFGAGFAGVKGFAGGFGRRALAPWGEPIIKAFVREAVEEALRLEAAMAKLWNPVKVAVLHYSPIRATVEGEPPEVMAFLGSSRLEESVDRYRATVVFHGHSHHGSPEGRTKSNIPVYNVSMPLLRQLYPDRPPFRLVELPLVGAVPPAPGSPGEPGPTGPGPGPGPAPGGLPPVAPGGVSET